MASVKIAADFLGLALADVLLAIGQSAFSGNAASMSLAPSYAGESALHAGVDPTLLQADQLQAIKRALDESRAA